MTVSPPSFSFFPGLLLLITVAVFAGCDESARGVLGSSCEDDSECNQGLFCSPETNTCEVVENELREAPDMTDLEEEISDADAVDQDTEDGDSSEVDGESCEEGETGICGDQIGACEPGTRTCVDGQWGPCEGAIGPSEEVCDNVDNDCDGIRDEAENGSALQQDCGESMGECVTGVQSCVEGVWGPCKGEIGPQPEVCDMRDNDCDGVPDNDADDALTWYLDSDGDGFGDSQQTTRACGQPMGYVADNTDCDDAVMAINPNATEVCDTVDNDCDTFVDEGDAAPPTWYADTDGDQFGDPANTTTACVQPMGYVADDTDCNDSMTAVNPAATEVCNMIDDNCVNGVDEGMAAPKTWYADIDMDNFGDPNSSVVACMAPAGHVGNSTDCDDTNTAVNPNATEVCNLIDDNCRNGIDEGVESTWYADTDGDNYGDVNNTTTACSPPMGFVGDNTDCNDSIGTINPGATEICNLIDDNCVNGIDEGVKNTYYADTDSDNYGNATNTTLACSPPAGYVADNTDCNDAVTAINPGATEVCNLVDDNCVNGIDEGVKNTYYADTDSDNYGDATNTTLACSPPAGYVTDNTDCNDAVTAINPGATEVCNLIDDNCINGVDEGVKNTYYADTDSDNYGDPGVTTLACNPPMGFVADNTDCNDAVTAINPGATEVCNLIDDNCVNGIDEGVQNTYYRDADGDNYGNSALTSMACNPPAGFVANDTDCNDSVTAINPGATEVCNLIDDNCVNGIDEGVQNTYYRDSDGDNHGVMTDTVQACSPPMGYVALGDDCDDADDRNYPGGPELCDNADNNCNNLIDDGVATTTFYRDVDGDNFGIASDSVSDCNQPAGYVPTPGDCDDNSAAVNPNATEVCNLIDDNCVNGIDEGVQNTYFADTDSDGYGDGGNTTLACTVPAGYVTNADDCNDGNTNVNPGATEVCNLIDDNCVNGIDEGVKSTFYRDQDADMYGTPGTTTQACVPPAGFVADNTDCNDTMNAINPGATEVCNGVDDNCINGIDEGVENTYYRDADSDNYGNAAVTTTACSPPAGYVTNSTDCNDGNNGINPGATEVCNGVDDNCINGIDEGVENTYYRDADNDNYGNAGNTAQACSPPAGYVADNTDCNDSVNAINPGATEVCDGIDNNCVNGVDEGVENTYYRDADNDGYGNVAVTTTACSPPAGYVTNSTDCNDGNSAVNPGATEVCDGIDNNCVNGVDEGVENTYYRDADNDGYGDVGNSVQGCSPPAGYVVDNTDCDDSRSIVNPAETEVCDGLDNNCINGIDEGVQNTYYRDADSDGFGNPANSTLACTTPGGFVTDNTDCNDSLANVNPAETEVCDGIDNNCVNGIDEGVQSTWYRDADSDNYGDAGNTTLACSAPAGYVADNTDCNDSLSNVNPGETEVCDNLDNNCVNGIDEGVRSTFFRDADDDTYGNPAVTILRCAAPIGYTANNTDCDDSLDVVYPGAPELCDGRDNDCDTDIDEGCPMCDMSVDNDFDGANECDDCDESNGSIYPGAPEVCDGLDNDCDTLIDEDFDADMDGWSICATDPTLVDCDDNDPNVNPGMAELCGASGTGNGIDDNCNGYIDEGCNPCDPMDTDGDGVSECDGDCDPNNGDIFPGSAEICDGLDNDCNIFTTKNCDVSDPCNFAAGVDVCKNDLLCACAVDRNGTCNGNYLCTAFCNTSATGTLGDGCASDQTCLYDLLRSANVHGCAVTTDAPGSKTGGETCSNDADCRSNNCDRLCVGPGCNQNYCIDYCGSDDYCTAPNTVCELRRTSSNIDGQCVSDSAPIVGSSSVGQACSVDSQCDHGFCNAKEAECTEPCCKDSDCPSGYTCGLTGDYVDTSYAYPPPSAQSCSVNSDCPTGQLCVGGSCGYRLAETSPMCVPDVSGQGTRQAGAACSQNSDCESNFCDSALSVCVESCCNDSVCPTGLSCEMQYVELTDDRITQARVCVNLSTEEVFLRK